MTYEKPSITDIGSLRELTAGKPSFHAVTSAEAAGKKGGYGGGGNHTSMNTSGFSGATTAT